MPKVIGGGIAALVVAVMLTGCAGTTTPDASEPATVASSAPSESVAPEATVAPLVAETGAPAVEDADAAFLEYVRENLWPTTSIPNATDEQLIAAGQEACDLIRGGTPVEDVRVVEGEEPATNGYYMDSSAIMNGALVALCPDLI